MGDENVVIWQKRSINKLWKYVIAFIHTCTIKFLSLLHPEETYLFNIYVILSPDSTVIVIWLQKEEHNILSTLENNEVEYQEVIEVNVRCGHF